MDISANSKEGRASAIEPSTSYIPMLHGMLAWDNDRTARPDKTVSFVLDCAHLTSKTDLVGGLDRITCAHNFPCYNFFLGSPSEFFIFANYFATFPQPWPHGMGSKVQVTNYMSDKLHTRSFLACLQTHFRDTVD